MMMQLAQSPLMPDTAAASARMAISGSASRCTILPSKRWCTRSAIMLRPCSCRRWAAWSELSPDGALASSDMSSAALRHQNESSAEVPLAGCTAASQFQFGRRPAPAGQPASLAFTSALALAICNL